MNVGTDESFLKLKFSQEIINNGEKCGWLKQSGRLMKNMFPTNSGLIYIYDLAIKCTCDHIPVCTEATDIAS